MNVFLTGATGFLGGELAVLLSKRSDVGRIYCLVRPDGGEEPLTRLERVFQFHGDFFDRAKLIPVRGDLADSLLAEKLGSLKQLQEVDVVIHAAADTSFGPGSAEGVRKVNIGGTLEILRWSPTLPRLGTFVYVGTASICGMDLVNCNIHEDQSPRLGTTHLVRYCFTKLVAEMNVRRMIPPEKLLIVRPSIIMGDSRDWTPRSYVILWALAAVNLIRLVPADPRANLDIIPVDYAAQALLELLSSKRRWTTYHISAGEKSATQLKKITAALGDSAPERPDFKFVGRELIHQMKKWPKKLLPSSQLHRYDEHLSYWKSVFNGNGHLRLLLAGIEPYFQFVELNQTFDNSRLLADTSLESPPPPHEYLRKTQKHLHAIDVVAGALDP